MTPGPDLTCVQNWDRVVAPDNLVTSGIYARVQHPIYTSYMLLFAAYALLLHSAPYMLALVWVCWWHYSRRTVLEAEVLKAKFGQVYEDWAAKTPRFVPSLLPKVA